MEKVTKAQLNRRNLIAAAGGAAALAATGHPAAAGTDRQGEAAVRYQQANLPTPREETVVIETDPVNVWDSFNPFIPNGEAYNYGLASICREYLFT